MIAALVQTVVTVWFSTADFPTDSGALRQHKGDQNV